MKTFLFALFLSVSALACSSGSPEDLLPGSYVGVVVDTKRGVTCYYFSGGIDCIPNSELKAQ